MKISNKIVSKFQEGGQAPMEGAPQETASPEAAPAQGGGEDPIMQLAQMAAQALQGQDCQMMAQVCEAFISLAQGASGQEQAPQEAPVYKKGGVLVKRVKN